MQPRVLSGCRFVSSTGPAWHLCEQPNSTGSTSLETSRENQHGSSGTRFFFRQGHATVCGCNRRTNRSRRCERRFHIGKTAFKHPFIRRDRFVAEQRDKAAPKASSFDRVVEDTLKAQIKR